MALEYRIVDQDRDVKVVKREYVWKDETRVPGAADYDPLRIVQIYGTDESVDRHNTKLRVDGWDLNDYRKNPTFLWAHNMDPAVSTMPLGSVIGVQREEFARADGAVNKRLLFDVEFPKRGTYGFADLACDMYKQGHLRAASVGFRNLKLRRLNAEHDEDEMKKEGYDLKAGFAADLTHNALIELSGCSVGSNPNALAKALRDAAPAEVRALLDHDATAQGEIDDDWILGRLQALHDALGPTSEATAPSDDEPAPEAEEPITEPTSDEGDALERAIEDALAEQVKVAAPTNDDVLKIFKDEMSQQLKSVLDEIKALREELKQVRGVAPGADHASASPAEPTPSHLDELTDENVEALERISSLLPRR